MTSKSDSNKTTPFIFTTCQVGAEPALKKEISREHPELKFAYSQPGFVTFKHTSAADLAKDFTLKSVFARSYGVSIGKSLDVPAVAKNLLSQIPATQKKLRLHVWEKDFHPPGKEPLGFEAGKTAKKLESKLRKELPFFETSPIADLGDLVLDVVILDNHDPNNPVYWLGTHIHTAVHSPFPGGNMPIELPSAAPSRAYLKIEEAIRWSGAPVRAKDTAVEIGSAPGGASFALLQRGLNVVGIDPADMDPRVLKHPAFKHFKSPVGQVLREDLPESIQWLLLDINVEPRISLFAVDRLASRIKSLHGIFLTIKLNQWKIADEIPAMLEHVRAIGMSKIRAAQLSHCRQEFIICGLTRKGLAISKGTQS